MQSRISNDIGGVQNVVTSTATSIVSNATTVLATVVAMFVLDWRLALFSLGLLPLFVGLTRRVGRERKRITATRQESMADIATLVQESLSVSGILLGKTMGRSAELAERFEDESSHLAELEVRQRMAGRWVMASIQTSFAIMPAAVYWFAGQAFIGSAVTIGTVVAFTTLQTRLFWPVGSLLNIQIDVQTSFALFDRVFEYLDLEVDVEEAAAPRSLSALVGRVEFDRVSFRYDNPGDAPRAAAQGEAQPAWTLRDVDLVVEPGTTTAVVGETGSGKTSLGYTCRAALRPDARGRPNRRPRPAFALVRNSC